MNQSKNMYILYMNIPKYVKYILEIITKNGFESFIVGGCIRDSLLGLTPKDWDITTNATPQQIKDIFIKQNKYFDIIQVGLKHGTIGIKPKHSKEIFDITTYRIDGEYKNFRHPNSIQFTKNIYEDISRRDFTINALACKIIYNQNIKEELIIPLNISNKKINSKKDYILYDIKKYHNNTIFDNNKKESLNDKKYCICKMQLHDYYGGIQDLMQKTIKCVGIPNIRFNEDALRIMRAIRLASVMPNGFTLQDNTKYAILKEYKLLDKISKERITLELKKLLNGKYANIVILEYIDIIKFILPKLNEINIMQLKLNCLSLQYAPNDIAIRFSLLFYTRILHNDTNKLFLKEYIQSCKKALQDIHFDNKTIQNILNIIEFLDYKYIKNKISIKHFLSKHNKKLLWQILCTHLSLQYTYASYNNKQMLDKIKDSFKIFEEIIKNNECYSLKQLPINGKDIKYISLKLNKNIEGKQIGNILDKILNLAINNKIAIQKEIILQEVTKQIINIK